MYIQLQCRGYLRVTGDCDGIWALSAFTVPLLPKPLIAAVSAIPLVRMAAPEAFANFSLD